VARFRIWPVATILAGAVLCAATALVATAALVKAPVPAILTATESSAEDLVDVALSGDRGEVVEIAASLKAKAKANGPAASALTRAGVPAAKVDQLEQRANRVAQLAQHGSFIAVALAANAVSQLMPDLYGRFQDPVPPTILALDYLDREVQLRSIARQTAKVAAAIEELGPAWARVRPRVVAAGGASEAAAFQKHVVALERLDPDARTKVQAEAVRGLALVDELEQVFLR
jgi:hypothetical protein